MRLQGISQHVGTLGMCAVVIARTRLAFAVGLHQETAKVGNEPIDFVGLLLPPGSHAAVERIGG